MITTATAWLVAGSYDRARAEALFNGGAYDPATVDRILDRVDANAAALGFAAGALLGQMAVETAWFRFGGQVQPSQWNFGGIGATDGGAAGASFASPEDGVHAMFAHHANYLFGAYFHWPATWLWLQPYAIRNRAVVAAGYGGTVTVIGDYGGGKWASDPLYAGKIVARGNDIGATTTGGQAMTVPRPPIDDSQRSPNRNGYAGRRRVDAVVWHITQGTNSLGWLCNPQSKASSNYLIARDGAIFELVPPTEDAWANGAVCKPDTTVDLIRKWQAEGANFNQRTISIEHEGFTSYGQGGSLTTPQRDASVALTAWLCDRFGVPADQEHILGHYEIDGCNRPNCPGFSQQEWSGWIGRVAAIVGGAAPPSPAPEPPFQHAPGFLDPLIDTFDWEGAGIVVYRKIRVYNDQEQRFYEREWSGNMGYSSWVVVS